MDQKLFSITVNSWGWSEARTFYFKSREEAEEFAADFPARDDIEAITCDRDKAEEKLKYTQAYIRY